MDSGAGRTGGLADYFICRIYAKSTDAYRRSATQDTVYPYKYYYVWLIVLVHKCNCYLFTDCVCTRDTNSTVCISGGIVVRFRDSEYVDKLPMGSYFDITVYFDVDRCFTLRK